MSYTFEDYKKSAEAVKAIIGDFKPEVMMILGSGLGSMGDEVEDPVYVDYKMIPGMKVSTAPFHKGRFVFGKLGGKKVAVMQGRLHCYEGYTMEEVSYPVRVLRLLGADRLILTNAAGCVNADWKIGELMLINDHIRLFGFGPLQGENIEEFGPRFNDMSEVYTKRLRDIAHRCADKDGIVLRDGVYMYFPGPSYETPSEIKAARVLGADAVGMSTVPEATAAAHCGMEILGITALTNMAAGMLPVKLSGDEVAEAAAMIADSFKKLIIGCLNAM